MKTTPHDIVSTLLQDLALGRRLRDDATLQELAQNLCSPYEVIHHSLLAEDDPLRIAALQAHEYFEAAAIGMPLPKQPQISSQYAPVFHPWIQLSTALHAFYEGDKNTAWSLVNALPKHCAPHALKGIFSALLHRPGSTKDDEEFARTILVEQVDQREGLGALEEAALYPQLLPAEMKRLLPILIKEKTDFAERIILWAFHVLSEEKPLSDDDIQLAMSLGWSEAFRLATLASWEYDPERALLFWLHSLEHGLKKNKIQERHEVLARLEVALELAECAQDHELFTHEIEAAAQSILLRCQKTISLILPIKSFFSPSTKEPSTLIPWLQKAVDQPVSHHSNPRRKRKKLSSATNLELFAIEASA
ncbi:MAG: hypothetical protein MI717_10230 [Spirochaetales bacterium]|nr:hypothetical protein [Spirochaetales bacterium]